MVTNHPLISTSPFTAPVDEPFYYLDNFETVIRWVLERYSDLLDVLEIERLQTLLNLPRSAKALLARMTMRKGNFFRLSKLNYSEIGCIELAMQPLIEAGWIEPDPSVSIDDVFDLLTKEELFTLFKNELSRTGRKADWLLALKQQPLENRTFSTWCDSLSDQAVALKQTPLCERIRLLFFGNLNQSWSEFVLAELGIFRYEAVPFTVESRAFRTRVDVDHYLMIHRCRELLEGDEAVNNVTETLNAFETDNPWIERRRAKLLFRIAQHSERRGDLEAALNIYGQTNYAGARARNIRVLERLNDFAAALPLCMQALEQPESEAERQQLLRMLPRLQRRLGQPAPKRPSTLKYTEIDLLLPLPEIPLRVEAVVQTLLQRDDAPIVYVENALINSLLGLLCWDAIFAPIAGAFFHPFQHGPADLLHPEFYTTRALLFESLLQQLENDTYRTTIRTNYCAKYGIQSPFVYWGTLDESLLDHALNCIPAQDLRKLFTRLLQDIKNNRAGLPDLIQFWPSEQRYQMIEVKGPGDRLQDNQRRWIDFCVTEEIPVAVCYVQWQPS